MRVPWSSAISLHFSRLSYRAIPGNPMGAKPPGGLGGELQCCDPMAPSEWGRWRYGDWDTGDDWRLLLYIIGVCILCEVWTLPSMNDQVVSMVWETNPSKQKLTQSETKALGRESSKAANESDQVFHSLKMMGLSYCKRHVNHVINMTN